MESLGGTTFGAITALELSDQLDVQANIVPLAGWFPLIRVPGHK